jgi:hypothetical protein
MTVRDRVVLIQKVPAFIKITVAAIRTGIREGRRDIWLFRKEIFRGTLVRNLGVYAFGTALFAFQNPSSWAHAPKDTALCKNENTYPT